MLDITSFEKKYVSNVEFDYGDTIIVTAENIEHLRKCFKNSKFKWMSGRELLDPNVKMINGKPTFDVNRILFLDKMGTWAREFDDLEPFRERALKAINYIFVKY